MGRQHSRLLRVAVLVAVVAIGFYGRWQREQQKLQQPPVVSTPSAELPSPVQGRESESASVGVEAADSSAAPPALPTVVPKQTIRDQTGRVVFRGDVDVSQTLERIERGRRLQFSHDGITFENRERRLPRQAAGYYHEYVHPTPGVGGPGPQRIVTGRDGEIYYTPDHYRTFRRLDRER